MMGWGLYRQTEMKACLCLLVLLYSCYTIVFERLNVVDGAVRGEWSAALLKVERTTDK